jgi:hypothetical protein
LENVMGAAEGASENIAEEGVLCDGGGTKVSVLPLPNELAVAADGALF